MTCYCYLLECSDGSFYCGWTMDLKRRLKMHSSGKGARYTRTRLPVKLIYSKVFSDRAEARHRERLIKRMTHADKKKLMESFHDQNN